MLCSCDAKVPAVALREAADSNGSESWMCTFLSKNQINVHIMFYKRAKSDTGGDYEAESGLADIKHGVQE